MLKVRAADDRGFADHGWLVARHSFSFADYRDPAHMGFRALRVINEDRVAPRRGFGTHPHRDMEIITYVLGGAVEHKDSMGNGSIIRPGDVQRMTAGTGVTHSEKNPLDETLHLLQIWILPERQGLQPSYEQRTFDPSARRGRLARLASPDGEDGAVTVHQDVTLWGALLDPGQSVTHTVAEGRHAWIQVAKGAVTVAGKPLVAGDGAHTSASGPLEIHASVDSDVLVLDLA